MKNQHPGRTLTLPAGVFRFLLRRVVVAGVVIAGALGLGGCQPGPETFAQRFDAAVETGRIEATLPLLTRSSRALVETLGQATGEGANPFTPRAGGGPTKVLGMRAFQDGLLLQVTRGGATNPDPLSDDVQASEWVLRKEDGAWRLDLLATASRRPLR